MSKGVVLYVREDLGADNIVKVFIKGMKVGKKTGGQTSSEGGGNSFGEGEFESLLGRGKGRRDRRGNKMEREVSTRIREKVMVGISV